MRTLNIKKIRIDKNLSQKDVFLNLGIRQSTYSQYENGKREPSCQMIVRLAKALDCSIEEIVMCFV